MDGMDRSAGVVVDVAGRKFVVRRTHATIKRIEDRFGAVGLLLDRVEQYSLTAQDLVDFHRLLLHDEADTPTSEAIAEHIIESGITAASAPLREFCQRCWLGDEGWQRLVEIMQANGQSDDDAGNGTSPMASEDRHGAGSSRSPAASVGNLPSSGAQPTTNSPSLPGSATKPINGLDVTGRVAALRDQLRSTQTA
jgi:hypothetical protein